MFGSWTQFQDPMNTDFGEQLLNKVATQSLRQLFSESESVEVSIRCYPSSKLLQGCIDSFKMQGRALVIRREFYVEEMSFETDAITLDFASVLRGQVRLKQPAQAIAQVVLSEAGINRAFTADLVKQRLQNLDLPGLEGVMFGQIKLRLLPHNQVAIEAIAQDGQRGGVPIQVVTTLSVERRRRIGFTAPQFQLDGIAEAYHARSQQLGEALVQALDNMVDLDRFDLDGVEMRINRLETQGKKLVFSGYAQIHHFPKGGG